MKLTFEQVRGNVTVHEIKAFGFPSVTAKYTVGTPRLLVTERDAEAMAKQAFQQWQQQFFRYESNRRRETENMIIFTYYKDTVDVFRVTVNKQDGSVTTEGLAQLTSTESENNPTTDSTVPSEGSPSDAQ